MRLLKTSLFRSFAIGFVLGAVGVAVILGGGDHGFGGSMVPAAVAAPAQ